VTVPATGELRPRHEEDRHHRRHSQAQRRTIQVNGTIPCLATTASPTPASARAQTEDHGEIEFLVAFTKSNN